MGGVVGGIVGICSGKVQVWAGVPSLLGTGLVSAVSDPIEDVDILQFWYALVRIYKHPPIIPGMGFLRKATLDKVIQGGFQVTQVLDGELMDQIGKGTGDGQHVEITYVHRTNKEQRTIRTVSYWKSGKVRTRNFVMLHASPLRLEAWYEVPGPPLPPSAARDRVQWILDLILKRTSPSTEEAPQVHFLLPKEGSSDEHIISEPLDGYVSFERLWDEWVDTVKYHPKDKLIMSSELLVTSDTEFVVVQSWSGKTADKKGKGRGTGKDVESVQQVTLRKEEGEVHVQEWRDLQLYEIGDVPERFWMKFHRAPLCVECWGEMQGERKADSFTQATMQAIVDMIIADPIHPGEIMK